MCEENCQSEPLSSGFPVISLPVALYVSDGMIFELYDGGRPRRKHIIRWERLKTVDQPEVTK